MRKLMTDYEKMELIYELYEQKMFAIAFSILKHVEQAEDVVQESFIKIMKHLNRIDDPKEDKTKWFVIQTIKNTAIDTYRKNKKEMNQTIPMEEEKIQEHHNIIEMRIDHMYQNEYVKGILDTLPEKYKEIITYRCFYELSVKETSEILQISSSSVRKRYERAKKMLVKQKGVELNEMAEGV